MFFLYPNFRGSYHKTIEDSGFKKYSLSSYVAYMHTSVILKHFWDELKWISKSLFLSLHKITGAIPRLICPVMDRLTSHVLDRHTKDKINEGKKTNKQKQWTSKQNPAWEVAFHYLQCIEGSFLSGPWGYLGHEIFSCQCWQGVFFKKLKIPLSVQYKLCSWY